MGKTVEHDPISARQKALGEVGRMGIIGSNLFRIGAADVVARSQIPDTLNQEPQPHTQENNGTPAFKPSGLSRLRTAVTVFFNSEDGLPHKGNSVIDIIIADESTVSSWHSPEQPSQKATTDRPHKPQPTITLNSEVSKLLSEALDTKDDLSRHELTLQAATRAMAVSSVSSDLETRGFYALTAVIKLIEAGEQGEAEVFARTLTEGSIPDAYKDRINKELQSH